MINEYAQQQIDRIAEECKGKGIKVAIHSITYNHGPYLADALEGFVKQQTNFPFVAIVHDDASTDNTAEVLREYAERYPDIIKPIYEKENQYSKGNGSITRIMRKAVAVTEAPYVAMCEGDDYWIDPLKLQKQVDFLEANPDYSMVFANAIEHWEDGSKPDKIFSDVEYRDYLRIEFIEKWTVPTASVVYRLVIDRDETQLKAISSGKLLAGDILLFLTCFKYGKVRGMNDVVSVYRRLETGAVRSVIDKQVYRFMIHEITMGKIFKGEILKWFRHKTGNRVVLELKKLKKKEKIDLRYISRAFWFAPYSSIRQLIRYI